MNYILFLGSRLGYETLDILTNLDCNIIHAFIESEHEHEHEKFYQRSIDQCNNVNISFSIDASQKEIKEILFEKANANLSIDYIMSFGYRRMIPDDILESAKIAALGTHFSPLPRYRGFAPLNWVLINGESETAVNLFYLDKEVDNGDIIDREIVPIKYEDDINTLFERCLITFKSLIRRVLPKLEQCVFKAVKQDNENATYTCARNPEDGLINWEWSAKRIYNLTRALTYPYPGAFTFVNGQKVTIWSCEEYETPKYEGRLSGKVIKIIKGKGVVILCGEGALLLKSVQIENGERKTADNIFKSVRLTLGVK